MEWAAVFTSVFNGQADFRAVSSPVTRTDGQPVRLRRETRGGHASDLMVGGVRTWGSIPEYRLKEVCSCRNQYAS